MTLVNRFGIAAEQELYAVGETRHVYIGIIFPDKFHLLQLFNWSDTDIICMNQQMEVIRHETVCQNITVGGKVVPNLLKEVMIVARIVKNTLPVITTVIHVVHLLRTQIHTGEV